MSGIINYFTANAAQILVALWQHLYISLIAAVIAILISLPLAIAMIDHRRGGEFILQVAGVIQTIPSLAILGLLIPFVGIGTVPAVIALVLYAIMPIFQNSYAGLTTIDPMLIEAADAFGVPRRFKLLRIQLPLALPMIMAGIRIAVVMIIGTTTLAALIGGGGLGTYILEGIQSNNNNALIVGAGLAAVLALVVNGLIKVLERLSMKQIIIVIGAVALLFGSYQGVKAMTGQRQETITIAGKLGSEPEVLINMYKDLIQQDDPHVKVVLKPDFGGTSFLFKALQSGRIDVYPEFTGTVLQSLVKHTQVSHDPHTAYEDAKSALSKQFSMTYLTPMKYQNTYAMTVRSADAQKYQLTTISDLTKVPNFEAAFDPDFYQQSDGYPGLKTTYGINFSTVKTMEPSLRYRALVDSKVDVTDAYTTDPQIKQYHLTVLKDNKSFFPPYQGAPLMKTSFARQHPAIVRSLNRLSGKISDADMQSMNYQVTVQHKKASVVAKNYLQKHGFLGK